MPLVSTDWVEKNINNLKKQLPCAVYLNGEYGAKDIYAGVPVIIGSSGVEKIIELRVQLFGSGSLVNEVIEASEILRNDWDIESDIWSVTSYNELRKNGEEVYRYNRLHPEEEDISQH